MERILIATQPESGSLQRLIGAPTVWLLAVGVAVGSGILRTPGEIAALLPDGRWILPLWAAGGLIVLAQSLVSAELATRFPRAGGEYVYLREAYGEFAAFFFGWAYSIFIIGGGAAVIALAAGDFASELFGLDQQATWSAYGFEFGSGNLLAACLLVAVIGINALGLRAGAVMQNTLTLLKVLLLLATVGAGLALVVDASSTTEIETASEAVFPEIFSPTTESAGASQSWLPAALLAALLPVLWSYAGATDSVKLAEEVRDVRRALPRALLGGTLTLMLLYLLVNAALLAALPFERLAGSRAPVAELLSGTLGGYGGPAALVIGIVVCAGALSSTVLATVRVTFALGRDGLGLRSWGRMSASQAPIGALLAVGGFALLLAFFRGFNEVLGIYFLAAAILFGLSYASLIVFRRRERAFPAGVFRCPAGVALALGLIVLQAAMALHVIVTSPRDALGTLLLLAALAAVYLLRKRST